MNIEAIKIDLVQRLLSIEDEDVLRRIEALLDISIEVNPTLIEAIESALEDVKEGRVHSHSEVRKLYEQWLQK